VLPFVLLLSCPLMHFFMHHGKHDHDQFQPVKSKGEHDGPVS
jgi:hypothetical protein